MNHKIANIFLIIFFAIIQAICLYKVSPKEALETGSMNTIQSQGGDYVYYLSGALSLYQLDDPYLKFNDKKQPIAGSKPVPKNAISKSQSYLAIFYPFPSFKFGYSLSIAALTLPINNDFFQKYIPRLSFANYIFGLISFIFIILVLNLSAKNIYTSTIFTVLYTTDIFSVNNNYQYQSHTISGIMYIIIAYYLFYRNNQPKGLNYFIYFLLISLSILSSSHIVPLALSFAGLLGLNLLFQKVSLKEKFYRGLLGAIGFLALPCYIVLVEKLLNFEALGIPTYFFQIKWYSVVVGQLVSTYPLLERSIWDFRIWNHYILFILLPLALIPFFNRRELMHYKIKINLKSQALEIINNKNLILFLPLIFQLFVTSFYSQPIVRALVPNLIIYSLIISLLYGYLFLLLKSKIIKILIIALVSGLTILNLYIYIDINSKTLYRGEIFSGAPSEVIALQDKELIWKNIEYYFKVWGKEKMPQGELGIYSYTLPQLFKFIQEKYPTLNYQSIPPNLWLEIRPFDIVENYSNDRRFIPEFNNNKLNTVTTETILKDFSLYFSLFKYINSGYLSEKSVKIIPNKFWHPRLFDQEYNYIFGYNQKIKKYLKRTEMEDVDFRAVYYINLKDFYEIYRVTELAK